MTTGLELDVFVAPQGRSIRLSGHSPAEPHLPSKFRQYIRPIDLNLWKSMSKSSLIEAAGRRRNELVLAPSVGRF